MDDKKRREYQQLLEASAIGWMFPIAIGLGFGWGYGMDKLFGTWPWLTAIFTVLRHRSPRSSTSSASAGGTMDR